MPRGAFFVNPLSTNRAFSSWPSASQFGRDFPLPEVEELRRRGHDVLTVQDAGHSGIALPDAEVLAQAVAQNRVVLTFSRRHFVRLHAARPQHAGIVVCTFDPDFAGLAERISSALATAPETPARLLRIYRPN